MLPEMRELTLTLDYDTMLQVRELLVAESRKASDKAASIDPQSEYAWKFIPEEREYATHMSNQAEAVYQRLDTWDEDDGWPQDN